jgi:sec-independent protein translocase protein TatB
MFGIGMPEMILILAIALIVIGPQKLPDLAKSLGRAMREFKKATNELKDSLSIDEDIRDAKHSFDSLGRDLRKNFSATGSEKEPLAGEKSEKTEETSSSVDGSPNAETMDDHIAPDLPEETPTTGAEKWNGEQDERHTASVNGSNEEGKAPSA